MDAFDPLRGAGALATSGRRLLPCGWLDLGRQLAIWFGLLFAYQLVRGVADHNPAQAFWNGWRILAFEHRITHHLVELTAQRIVDSSHWLLTAAAWTYWNSEFTVVGLALLWVYLRRHERFVGFRNALLLANTLGLIGYLLWPTAPPRLFTSFGFEDTLDRIGSINHGSGIVSVAANPYAAMPSLHAADTVITAVILVGACRSRPAKALWALWPAWVSFCLVATANHFLLDIVAGAGIAALALLVVAVGRLPRRRHRSRAAGDLLLLQPAPIAANSRTRSALASTTSRPRRPAETFASETSAAALAMAAVARFRCRGDRTFHGFVPPHAG